MANNGTKKTASESTKEHCIDLPGERVQCWVGNENSKLKVILRKHRDVVFDFNVGDGSTYTLESTESDFYNVRDKKLMRAGQVGKVTFRDGEKMHIWIAREFRGALTVKAKGKIKSQIIPNQLDSYRYSNHPKEKPAPIIISVHGTTGGDFSTQRKDISFDYPSSLARGPDVRQAPAVSLPAFDYPVVCVVDGSPKDMPVDLIKYFEHGGDGSGYADVDPQNIATRNWIWGQVAGSAAYIKDNWEWLRASIDGDATKGFRLVKVKVRYVRGKIRFFYLGYTNRNTFFGRGGFGPGNESIMTIFGGAGTTKSAFAAAMKGVAGTFKGNALVSFIFGSTTAIIEWRADTQKDGYDLAASLIASILKALVVTILVTSIIAAIIYVGTVSLGLTISVIAVGVLTIAVGVGISYIVDAGDKSAGRAMSHDPSNADGVASAIAPVMRHAGHLIEKNWEYLASKMSGDYQEIRFDNAI